MQTKLYNQNGGEVGTIELSDKVFGLPLNPDLLHQARVAILANRRNSVAHAKDRSEVRGGGKKPWRQKGTGRARHGSIRSPIWKGGGVAHGPRKEKDYSKKINSAMSRKAVRIALSSKFDRGNIRIVDKIFIDDFKTKSFLAVLNRIFGGEKARSALFVVDKTDKNLFGASENIRNVKVETVSNLNILDVFKFGKIVFTKEAVDILENA